jgi:predicted ATPase
VLLAGDPGSGKSHMVQWLAREAAHRNARALVARCTSGTPMPPYWPWLDIVCGGSGEPSLRSLARELLGPVPAASEPAEPASGGSPLDASSGGALFGRLEAFAAFVRSAAARAPLVVVLDDVHLADTPSLLVLQWVAQQVATEAVLLVTTYRDGEVGMEHPLADTIAELGRLPWTTRIALPPFAETDVGACVTQLAGTAPSAAVARRIHAYTGGNPHFVAEVVQQLRREGRLAARAEVSVADLAVPQAIRDAVRGRIRRLPPSCGEMLTAAAFLEEPFSLERLAGVLGTGVDAVVAAVAAATTARLVELDAQGDPPACRSFRPTPGAPRPPCSDRTASTGRSSSVGP